MKTLRQFWALLAVSALFLSFSFSRSARAEGEEGFDLKVENGQVTVIAREHWHINKDFPWKLTVGDIKVDKTKFALTEKTATLVDAPKGTGKLRGAVCSEDVCKMVEKEITVR